MNRSFLTALTLLALFATGSAALAQEAFVKVVGGEQHGVALDPAGAVYAWGNNVYGQLGQGHFDPTLQIHLVPLPLPAIDVAGGTHFTLCLLSDGTVWSFGRNHVGQLGRGAVVADESTPGQIPGLWSVTDIEAGAFHALAINSIGALYAWGGNNRGQVGTGFLNDVLVPFGVALPGPVAQVSAGGEHTLAALADGTVMSWGQNAYGMLGLGYSGTHETTPQAIPGLSGVASVSAGYYHSVARGASGGVWAWGFNSQGQIGQGRFGSPHFHSPTAITLSAPAISAAAGVACSYALLDDGTLFAWGQNADGELGIGSTSNQHTPTNISSLTDVQWFDANGFRLAYAGTSTQLVYSWGRNIFGQLGLGYVNTMETLPQIIPLDATAPSEPLAAFGQVVGSVVELNWDPNAEPDLAEYRIYRGLNAGFEPNAASLMATTTDPTWTDPNPWSGPVHYKITAVDLYGNESWPAFVVVFVTLDAPTGLPTAFALRAPSPNPFERGTVIRFDVPRVSEVRLEVFDLSGRRVKRLVDGRLGVGRHRIEWGGDNDRGHPVAAGAYVLRMSGSGFRAVRLAVRVR